MGKNRKTAFSLIELSIVLVVTAIIIAGVLSASTASLNNAKIKITNDRIKVIYKALGNFILTNYRLPCPAALNIAKDVAGYGDSVGSAGSCSGVGVYKSSVQSSVIYGMIPISALGLPQDLAEDGFGNKLIYIVNNNYTAADYPATSPATFFSAFSEANNSNIRILQVSSGNVIDGNAFAIISLGQNKYGAFNSTGTTQNNTTSTDTYEQKHYLTNIDLGTSPYTASFGDVAGNANRVTITYENSGNDVFDDIVFFKTRNEMIIDFNAMFMIPCQAIANYNLAYYGQTVYRSTNCTAPNAVKPSKKCAAYGVWIDQQTCSTN